MMPNFIISLLCCICLLNLHQANSFTNPADNPAGNFKNIDRGTAIESKNMKDVSTETKERARLETSVVWEYVNHVLDEVNPSLSEKLGMSLRPITNFAEKGGSKMTPPLYFAIEIVTSGRDLKPDKAHFLSFYVGYSTWEGPCVFVDELDGQDDAGPNDQLYLQILAKIAVRLGSSRLTWKRHYPPQPSWYESNPAIGPPDILNELHILHMDPEAMKAYVDYSEPSSSSSISLDRSSVEQHAKSAIEEALTSVSNSKFSIRLAQANHLEDAQDMEQMVKGLAIYVKEPLEDIHCDLNDYLVDGSGDQPLYYTFLLEADDKDGEKKQVCGSAVVYFGYSYKNGHYLYLEDLYVDEAYQHQGAGSLALRMLTRLALKLNCESFQWLALDWNEPALNLYQNKMGAKIVKGKKVTRYTDTKLKDFADGFSSTLSEM